jgi:hypothetical protein
VDSLKAADRISGIVNIKYGVGLQVGRGSKSIGEHGARGRSVCDHRRRKQADRGDTRADSGDQLQPGRADTIPLETEQKAIRLHFSIVHGRQ